MYHPNPNMDESALALLSPSSNNNKRSRRSPRIPPNIPGADPGAELTSNAIPGRGEENDSTVVHGVRCRDGHSFPTIIKQLE